MKLAEVFKSLKVMEKKSPDLYDVLRQLLMYAAENSTNWEEIQISKDLWGYEWTYYQHKKTKKKLQSYEFFDKSLEVRTELGNKGEEAFRNEYEEVYDPSIYESHLKRLGKVCKSLHEMGFKTKVGFSKNYKKCSLKKQPESIWLTVKW